MDHRIEAEPISIAEDDCSRAVPIAPVGRSTLVRLADALQQLELAKQSHRQAQVKHADGSGAQKVERRAFPRHQSNCTVTIVPIPAWQSLQKTDLDWLLHASPYKGRLLNISMAGVAFAVKSAIPNDQRLYLRLENVPRALRIDVHAQTLRRMESDSQWTIVCRFERHLTFREVQELGHPLFASDLV